MSRTTNKFLAIAAALMLTAASFLQTVSVPVAPSVPPAAQLA
jgi:hypothetical protein